MRHRNWLVRVPIVGALLAGALLATNATATADDALGTQLGYTNTLCYDPLTFATITGNAGNRPDVGGPGGASVWYGIQHYLFVYPPCTVTVFANWRNLDTGDSGSVPVLVSGGWGFALPANPGAVGRADLPTGRGRISITTTTDRPHQAGPAYEFTVR
ncbi:hypothetical protein ACFWF7_11365 [Nocardia sp. NPDC060256]|uniref:hypothetical protein n=1 Tax=unclassified Nocardia TaxID=2637762 RepID=UPI00365B953A